MRSLSRLIALAPLLLMDAVTAALAQPEFVSPEIHADAQVTLRVHAPAAQAVNLQGVNFKEPQPMAKDAQGVWSITIGPLPPEIYSYTFGIDGATVTDPLNRRIKKWIRSESMFEIAGNPPLLASVQPVPHGVVHRHVFSSRTRQRDAAIQVYTPPGFDPKSPTTYPVVFLLHGYGDDETAWVEAGQANFIADNLIAAHRMVPAIIVMTNGHPVPVTPGASFPDYAAANLAALRQELLNEVMPLVEASYPVRRDAGNRAIVGLSMGGGQSLTLGLTHLNLFRWIGGFSSAAPTEALEKTFAGLTEATNKHTGEPRLLWIGVGREDFLLAQNQAFVGWLASKHVQHRWNLTDGGHEWAVWRRYLGDFLPLLFR